MDVPEAVRTVSERIEAACRRVGRRRDEVRIVAVTKTVPIEAIARGREAGIEDFAENYADELAAKARAVPARWHFIGKLQRGNAARIADHADFIHSAELGAALERIARRASRRDRTIPCLVQVDFTGERQGVPPEDLAGFLDAARSLRGIETVGLMTVPPWTRDPELTRPYFRRLRQLRDNLRGDWPQLVQLSMGMSGDYEVAVEEGATMLRIGTALFGERPIARQTRESNAGA